MYRGSPQGLAETYPLAVTITASTEPARVGDEVTYTVTVTNAGVVDATNVEVVPASTTIPCAPTATCPDVPALVWMRGNPICPPALPVPTCALGTLQPGSSSTLMSVMKVVTYLNPMVFAPGVYGVIPGGRLLDALPRRWIVRLVM